MRRPPRRGTRLFDPGLFARAYAWLGVLEATGAMAAFFATLARGGWRWGDPIDARSPLYLEATTACLAAIVIMQVANVMLCRSETRSLFSRDLRRNPLLLLGIAVELAVLAAIVYLRPGQAVFGTAPLSLDAWLYALPFAAGMILLEEGRKALVRLRG